MSFKNKVVLITGAGSGMGEATAILFAENGADVVIIDWNEDSAKDTAEKCKKFGNNVLVIKADISKDSDVKNIIDETINKFNQIDVLINNAGIMRNGNLLEGTLMDTYDEVMNINLRAAVHLTSLATPYLIKSKGCVVNTSSVAGIVAQKAANRSAYSISKAGIDCFTRLAALELGPSGVRINAVNPGPVNTKIMEHGKINFSFDAISKKTVLGRVSDPKEIAELIMYLSSEKAKGITGSTFLADNGMALV